MSDLIFNSVMHDMTGKYRLESEDPRWSQLLRSKYALSINGHEKEWVGYCSRLTANNPSTGNLVMFLELTVSKVHQIVALKTKPSQLALEQCCVSLHLSSLVMHYFCANLQTEEILRQLGLPPSWQYQTSSHRSHSGPAHSVADGEAILRALFDTLAAALHHEGSWMYDVNFYCTGLIMSMFSTQLYQYDSLNIFLSVLYQMAQEQLQSSYHKNSIIDCVAAKLMKGLLMHVNSVSPPAGSIIAPYTAEVPEQKLTEGPAPAYSATSLKDYIWNNLGILLQLPAQVILRLMSASASSPENGASKILPSKSLGTRCLNILNILLQNRSLSGSASTPQVQSNAFLQVLCELHDENLENGVVDQQQMDSSHLEEALTSLHVDLYDLTISSANCMNEPAFVMFIYSLLQKHPTYLVAISNSSDDSKPVALQVLIESLLEQLYVHHTTESLDTLYIVIINILMIVQDTTMRSMLFQKVLGKLSSALKWYNEKSIITGTLGDLILLTILRTSQQALFTFRDAYLLTNCSAILLNLSFYVCNIHAYAAERIVTVLLKLCSRYIKLKDSSVNIDISPNGLAESYSSTGTSQTELLSMMEEYLRVILLLVGVMLRYRARLPNIALLYCFVRKHEDVVAILNHRHIVQLLVDVYVSSADDSNTMKSPLPSGGGNLTSNKKLVSRSQCTGPADIASLVKLCIEKLEVDQHMYISVSEAIDVLRQCIIDDIPAISTEESNLTYSYEEGDNPEEFFIPFAWKTAVKAFPDISWELDKILLFNPYSTLLDESAIAEWKTQEDIIDNSPRVVDRTDSNPENLV